MTLTNEKSSALLVSRDKYQQAKELAYEMSKYGMQVNVFCDEAVMRRYFASLVKRQELQQTLLSTP